MKPAIKNALDFAIKVLYVMPAVLWDVIYLFLLMIVGLEKAFPVSWLYPTLPTVAAVLLWKGKWWGCIPGTLMGILIATQLQNEQVSGRNCCVYFAIMGILCYVTSRKKGEKE